MAQFLENTITPAPRNRRLRPLNRVEVSASDWDWLIGLFYADGCKFKDKWHYAVVFTLCVSEQHVLEKLLRILRTVGLSPSIHKKQGRNAFDIRSYSKHFYNSLPEKNDRYVPRVPLAYVAGLFDGDGHIGRSKGKNKWVFSQAKYPHLAEQVQRILSDHGPVTLHVVSRSNGWRPISRVLVLRDARRNLRGTEFASYCTRLSASTDS